MNGNLKAGVQAALVIGVSAGMASAADMDLPPPPPPALASATPAPSSMHGDVTVSGGAYGVDSGFSDRAFVSLMGSVYDDSGIGFHADVNRSMREEDANFVAVGASYAATSKARIKVMAGTSSSNEEILPELYVNGSVIYDMGPEAGVVLIPELVYRKYRSGVEEVQAYASINKYFPAFKDGSYVIGTVQGSVNHVSPGDNIGWETSVDVTHVRPYYMSYGIGAVAGSSAYDNLLAVGNVSVRNDYYGVKPHVSMYLSKDVEVFARAEFIWTDFYTLAGGYAGVKYAF